MDNAMVRARARAFRWRKMLDEGVHATLEDLARFYAMFFLDSPSTRGFIFTEQDQADMVAFVKLLR